MISLKDFKELLKTNKDLRNRLIEKIKDKISVSNVDLLIDACITKTETQLSGNEFISSIGGTALSVGSCRVSTINLVRIAMSQS